MIGATKPTRMRFSDMGLAKWPWVHGVSCSAHPLRSIKVAISVRRASFHLPTAHSSRDHPRAFRGGVLEVPAVAVSVRLGVAAARAPQGTPEGNGCACRSSASRRGGAGATHVHPNV